MRRNYIHTFIYERSFLACQTFQISNFTSVYTQLTSQNAHVRSYKATYHDEDTIYYQCIINSWEYNKFNSPNKPLIFTNMKRATGGGHLENVFVFWHSNRPYFLWRHNLRWRRRHKMQTASNASRQHIRYKQRVLMHRHQGWNVRHGLCHIYMRYLYIYELFIAFVCFVVCSLL